MRICLIWNVKYHDILKALLTFETRFKYYSKTHLMWYASIILAAPERSVVVASSSLIVPKLIFLALLQKFALPSFLYPEGLMLIREP